MSRTLRGFLLAALLTGGGARADVLRLFVSGLTPAEGIVLAGWSMSLGPSGLSGKVLSSSITFSHGVDATTVGLLKAHARQTLIASVVVEARATELSPVLYRLTLTGVRVTSLDASESPSLNGTVQWSVKAADLTLEQLRPAPAVAGNLKVPLE